MRTPDRSFRRLSGLFLVITIIFVLWLIVPSFFSNRTSSLGDSALDINIHDTYFVIANTHILVVMAVIALAFSFFYFGYDRLTGLRLNQSLGWAHGIGSLMMILAPISMLPFDTLGGRVPPRYYSDTEAPMFKGVMDLVTICLVVGILAQIIFVINLALSPFRKRSL
jgi:heme/copper-type cytochrome/quinol oxidase subunit 1